MNERSIRKIRDRVAQSLSYETAQSVGLSYDQLSGFISGYVYLDDATLAGLAAHLKMKEPLQ